MKISTVLTIATLTIGIIAVWESATSAYTASRNYQTVQTLRELVAIRGKLFEGLTSLSLERSLSQVQLSMEQGTDTEIAKMRADQRANSKTIFEALAAHIAQTENFALRDEVMEDLDLALATVNESQSEIDELLTLPLAKRNMVRIDQLIDQIKGKIIEMKGMNVHLVAENEMTSTQTMLLMRLQETVFDAREYGGRARSLFAMATLHRRTLTAAELEYAEANLIRAREAWLGVEHVTETIAVPPKVTAGIAEAQTLFAEGFFQLVANLTKQMKAAEKQSAAATTAPRVGSGQLLGKKITYSQSFGSFFETSSEALFAPAQLIITTSEELDHIWEARAVSQRNTLIFDILSLLAVCAVTLGTMWIVSTKITRKLKQGLDDLAALTSGEIDRELAQNPKDLLEIKALSHGLVDLQTQLQLAATTREAIIASDRAQKLVVDRLSDGLNALAAGDLSQRVNDRFDPKYQSLADNFNAAAAALGDLVARVISTSDSILAGAKGINSATTELSRRTETQGMTLQNAAAALEELTRNIVSSQSDATELDSLASLASDKGGAMVLTMSQTVEAIEKIKSSAQQIEQIVGLIEDIAFQTNLLALNAGVEATRAGVEGSGFAVIASEVRGLAERSSQSAQDIKALIATSGIEVTRGVELVAEAELAAGDIGAHIKMISELISRIATAASEQSQGLVKVNDGVSQLDLVTQTNVAMVEETTAECVSLSSVAQDLTQLVSRFQISAASNEFDLPQKVA